MCTEKESYFFIGKWDEAKRLLADIVNKGISPNGFFVNALISALCKDGKIQEAISVFDLMTQRGIRPDVITYTTLIHAFYSIIDILCKEGESSKAIEILKLMTRKGVTPNVFTYNSFIQGFCHSGQWEEVTSLLNRIMNGVHPNLVTFNSLINALCKENRIEEAITMLNLMSQGRFTFNSLINALCKEKRTEEAITMLELLSQRGVKLYGVTYNIIIRLYCGQREMNKAKDAFDSMGTRGL
ncbi:hypothetical protein ES288_A10G150900v1 [Gossypium darwinii]|uniref:Pentacotripeptide-repeat region of PRORP domain-containing protein n=1 Tax=Gossypium darwinii TaxID=34276 RepID=A0A5D2EYJ8_GOSDA|nr:hypothetical protein ES288_A10G150900v1 [Gossypium darwinii]